MSCCTCLYLTVWRPPEIERSDTSSGSSASLCAVLQLLVAPSQLRWCDSRWLVLTPVFSCVALKSANFEKFIENTHQNYSGKHASACLATWILWGNTSFGFGANWALRSKQPQAWTVQFYTVLAASLETTAIFDDILTVARKYVSDRGHALYIEKGSPWCSMTTVVPKVSGNLQSDNIKGY